MYICVGIYIYIYIHTYTHTHMNQRYIYIKKKSTISLTRFDLNSTTHQSGNDITEL